MSKGNDKVNSSEENALLIALMYDLLTDENKKIVNRLIEQLKVEQSGCR